MVQEDFLDSYNNLTVKSLMLLKWAGQTWPVGEPGPQFLLKTDDDM